MTDFFRLMKSSFTVEVTGENPGRFLNAAAAKGIYISEASAIKDGLRMTISRRAWSIMKEELPPGLQMERVSEHGAVKILRPLKKRYLLFAGAAAAAAITVLFSQFIWKVEITGGTSRLRKEAAEFLEEKNVRPMTLKKAVDQTTLKREAILAIDDLMWMWIDIKGATAFVRVEPRSLPPKALSSEPGNVIAEEAGIIESITALDGVPAVREGDTVQRGEILINGAVESELAEGIIRHGRGNVTARIWKDKTVTIPKVTEIRRRTEDVKKIKSIKIKNLIVNFSLNSRFFYPKYDRIRVKYRLWKFPAEFISDEYIRVETEEKPANIQDEKEKALESFKKELKADGAEIVSIKYDETDLGASVEFKITAECLKDIGCEVPM